MKLCRFRTKQDEIHVGIVAEDNLALLDLAEAGISRLHPLLEDNDPLLRLKQLAGRRLPRVALSEVRLCAPVEQQEVWAAGVTYLRSKTARMDESDFSATAYDRVYTAARPELFFKSLAEKVVATGEPVGIRRDAEWSVPEPELALMLNSRGETVGYTVANDMSSRDIEGENLLYLPQAKIYNHSCALGPWVRVGAAEEEARKWKMRIEILRNGKSVFAGETSVDRIKRRFEELAGYLFRCQVFPSGAVLLTGTGIVPPDTFTLRAGDEIGIEITGIGWLRNTVMTV